jgi:hypothetical protein
MIGVVNETPLLLLGYNRPHQMRGLIQSLAPLKPKLILLAVDGPRNNRQNDAELVRQTQELTEEISWQAEIRTRFRDSNLGLRRAVVDAVTWANSEYGRVIVLEDDIRAGPQLIEFLDHGLMAYQEQTKIAHINGYNLVPKEHLSNPDNASRLSIYPESYAWATWDRAWQKYDDNLTWAKDASISDIKKICGSTIGALRWKQNFNDAFAERIDTWAYRWLASMWEHRFMTVSPNRNVSFYVGTENGTHTFLKVQYQEPKIEFLENFDYHTEMLVDESADKWLKEKVFYESILGVTRGIAISATMNIRKVLKDKTMKLKTKN